MAMTGHRWFLAVLTLLAVVALVVSAVLAIYVDRAQCRAAATAVHNSRTMWEFLIEKYPGVESDEFQIELDKRIRPAHCKGGTLIVDEAVT